MKHSSNSVACTGSAVVVVGIAALFFVIDRAVAQMSAPWAAFYETPIVSTIDAKFLERIITSVELDPEQVEEAQSLLRDHVRRWDEFLDRARPAIAATDERGRELFRASHARFVFMAEREAALEGLVKEQLALDRQFLDELRGVLREHHERAWEALLDTAALETLRRGPALFPEEHLCLPSLLRDASVDVDFLHPEHRARVRGAVDGWRHSAALAAREVVAFRTAVERRHHRNLLPHVMADHKGGVLIDSSSPAYASQLRGDTRRMTQVHTAARDATRQGATAVAAALGDDGSLVFRRTYWLAALPSDDRPRLEAIVRTIDRVLALESVDPPAKQSIARDWPGWNEAWIDRARTLVESEDRLAVARVDGGDVERATRSVQHARDAIREVENFAVLQLIHTLGDQAVSVLDAEGVADWIRATVPPS